jgi:cytochrome b561
MPSTRYDAVAIGLHWLIALGILALIAIGLTMTHMDLGPMAKFRLYQLHKSIGITVLFAMVLRVLWRLIHRPPPLPDAMPPLERTAAEGAHAALYAFLFFLPLTGWALVSASPFNIPTVLYGVIPWPHLPVLSTLEDKAPVEHVLKLVHGYAAWLLIALVLVHAGAALRHHFILRDGILRRMLPAISRKTQS